MGGGYSKGNISFLKPSICNLSRSQEGLGRGPVICNPPPLPSRNSWLLATLPVKKTFLSWRSFSNPLVTRLRIYQGKFEKYITDPIIYMKGRENLRKKVMINHARNKSNNMYISLFQIDILPVLKHVTVPCRVMQRLIVTLPLFLIIIVIQ